MAQPPSFREVEWKANNPADWLFRVREGLMPKSGIGQGFLVYFAFTLTVGLAISIHEILSFDKSMDAIVAKGLGMPSAIVHLLIHPLYPLLGGLLVLITTYYLGLRKQLAWKKTLVSRVVLSESLRPVFDSIETYINSWWTALGPRTETAPPTLVYDPNNHQQAKAGVSPCVISFEGRNTIVIPKKFISKYGKDRDTALALLSHELGHCLLDDGREWTTYRLSKHPLLLFALVMCLATVLQFGLMYQLIAALPKQVSNDHAACQARFEELSDSLLSRLADPNLLPASAGASGKQYLRDLSSPPCGSIFEQATSNIEGRLRVREFTQACDQLSSVGGVGAWSEQSQYMIINQFAEAIRDQNYDFEEVEQLARMELVRGLLGPEAGLVHFLRSAFFFFCLPIWVVASNRRKLLLSEVQSDMTAYLLGYAPTLLAFLKGGRVRRFSLDSLLDGPVGQCRVNELSTLVDGVQRGEVLRSSNEVLATRKIIELNVSRFPDPELGSRKLRKRLEGVKKVENQKEEWTKGKIAFVCVLGVIIVFSLWRALGH